MKLSFHIYFLSLHLAAAPFPSFHVDQLLTSITINGDGKYLFFLKKKTENN